MKKIFFLLSAISTLITNGQTMRYKKMTTLIEGKDARLFTTVYPRDNAETVILLHGGPGVPDDLTFVAEFLSEHFQVITFHQRGTAKSPIFTSDFSMESYIADIDSISNYFNLEKFHLFGHSWGGLYAQIYAEEYPQKILSMFLSSPSSGTGYQWKETEKEVMAFNKSKLNKSEWLSMGWNSLKGMFGSNKAYQKVFTQVLVNYNKGFEYTDQSSIDLKDLKDLKAKPINKTRNQLRKYPALKTMPIPQFKITITYGDKDIYGASKRYVKDRYPTANIYTIANCGHLPSLHNKTGFIQLLNSHYSLN